MILHLHLHHLLLLLLLVVLLLLLLLRYSKTWFFCISFAWFLGKLWNLDNPKSLGVLILYGYFAESHKNPVLGFNISCLYRLWLWDCYLIVCFTVELLERFFIYQSEIFNQVKEQFAEDDVSRFQPSGSQLDVSIQIPPKPMPSLGILRNLSLKRKASLPNYERRLLLSPSVSETSEKPLITSSITSPYWKRCLSLPSTNAAKLSQVVSTPPVSAVVHSEQPKSNVSSRCFTVSFWF